MRPQSNDNRQSCEQMQTKGQLTNRIIVGDCIKGMRRIPDEFVDLVFADPPFNIGYEYDTYEDDRPPADYLAWSRLWIAQVKRVLKPTGAFWLAIGDEYAAELKMLATRELGLACRSWVIWYYTFGVHCESKFTRSHAHLFHFVRDPNNFVFNQAALRVPSARQLVYADKRANPKGRVPDDTWIIRPAPDSCWILRPQDLPEGFASDSDTWYFPRVCGTFRERMRFHGCQMPEQLLGRIIRVCSNEGDLVIDPFVGSGTTLAVAKKLNRRYFGFELSPAYAKEARKRLHNAKRCSPLDGSEYPLTSAPRKQKSRTTVINSTATLVENGRRRHARTHGLTDFEREVVEAFDAIRSGYSTDRVVADPEMNGEYVSLLQSRGVQGEPVDWNLALLRLRKATRLKLLGPTKRTVLDADKIEQCEFAAEIALRQVRDQHHKVTLDTLLCSPALARAFDQLASGICPGFEPLYYRWAALRIRKYSKDWREAGHRIADKLRRVRFSRPLRLEAHDRPQISVGAGLYSLQVNGDFKYVGDTPNLSAWVSRAQDTYDFSRLGCGSNLAVAVCPLEAGRLWLPESTARKGAKSVLIKRRRPSWNLLDLAA